MSSWQSRSRSTVDRLRYLYEDKCFWDIELVVADENGLERRIKAHKLVLSVSSEVLEGLLKESINQTTLSLQDMNDNTLEIILRYCYLDQIEFDYITECVSVCKAAKKYSMDDLYQKCVAFVKTNLNPDTACQIYDLVFKSEITELKDHLLRFVMCSKSEILTTSSFVKCSETTAMALVNLCADHVVTELLFDSVLKWAEYQCELDGLSPDCHNLRAHMKDYLPHISFLRMTQRVFLRLVAPTGILTKEEILAIVMNMDTSGQQVHGTVPELPEWCNPRRFNPPYNIKLSQLKSTQVVVDLQHEVMEEGAGTESLECCFLTRQKGLELFGFVFGTWILPRVWTSSNANDPSRLVLSGMLTIENEATGEYATQMVEPSLSGSCTDSVVVEFQKAISLTPGKRVKIKFLPLSMVSGRAFCWGKYEKCLRVIPKGSKSVYILEFSDYENAFSRLRKCGLLDKLILKVHPGFKDISST